MSYAGVTKSIIKYIKQEKKQQEHKREEKERVENIKAHIIMSAEEFLNALKLIMDYYFNVQGSLKEQDAKKKAIELLRNKNAYQERIRKEIYQCKELEDKIRLYTLVMTTCKECRKAVNETFVAFNLVKRNEEEEKKEDIRYESGLASLENKRIIKCIGIIVAVVAIVVSIILAIDGIIGPLIAVIIGLTIVGILDDQKWG